ncbi:hypothetical protein CsSME_00026997 [Camellia sinensis var. sinensis]
MANDGNGTGSSVSGIDPMEKIMKRAVTSFWEPYKPTLIADCLNDEKNQLQ